MSVWGWIDCQLIALRKIRLHIHVHLANVLMRKFASLEIKENKALEQVIVKDEVDIKVLGLRADALLAGDERKAFAQLEQEGLEIINQGMLQVGFQELSRAGQSQEFQHDRIADELARR
jgi:hypothetical protein